MKDILLRFNQTFGHSISIKSMKSQHRKDIAGRGIAYPLILTRRGANGINYTREAKSSREVMLAAFNGNFLLCDLAPERAKEYAWVPDDYKQEIGNLEIRHRNYLLSERNH